MKLIGILLLFCGTSLVVSCHERQCGTDLRNLWLDVVLVVDNSNGMTRKGLSSIAANIATVFSASRIGEDPNYNKTVRIGLVTYNEKAQRNADLHEYRSFNAIMERIPNELKATADTPVSFISTGLQAAQDLLFAQSFSTSRDHYRKVVIVYASTYKASGKNDPRPVVDRMRGRGVKIITVAYNQGGENIVEQLSKIADPGFSFNNSQNVVNQIQNALFQVNCFCPSDNWHQYTIPFFKYGTCIQPVGMPSMWRAARVSCAMRLNNNVTYLATEFSRDKHDFILRKLKDTDTISPPYNYHIGLHRVNGQWTWDQPDGVSVQGWENWAPGYPKAVQEMSAGMNVENGQGAEWRNVDPTDGVHGSASYVCETYACDTDNYCATGDEQ